MALTRLPARRRITMSDHNDPNQSDLKQSALDYHRQDPPGKIKVAPTKPLVTQRDLALAYSPGVAYACEAIVEDPNAASEMTARGNLVAVITNGTAVSDLVRGARACFTVIGAVCPDAFGRPGMRRSLAVHGRVRSFGRAFGKAQHACIDDARSQGERPRQQRQPDETMPSARGVPEGVHELTPFKSAYHCPRWPSCAKSIAER